MDRSRLAVIILIVICLTGFREARAQALVVSCDRSSIESYPGSEKEPVLRYLDEVRRTSDEFMRLFAEDRLNEIYKINRYLTITVLTDPPTGQNPTIVQMTLPEFRQRYGRLSHYEYRNQHVSYILHGPIELRGTSGTWYELMTGDRKGHRQLILVETHRYRVEEKMGILGVGIHKRRKDRAEPWKYNEGGRQKLKGCVTLENRLIVKID